MLRLMTTNGDEYRRKRIVVQLRASVGLVLVEGETKYAMTNEHDPQLLGDIVPGLL